MSPDLQAKLERLRNFQTRYEIAATRGAERVLIGYCARRGRSGLLAMVRQNLDKFGEFFAGHGITWGKRAADGFQTDSGWSVNFSGRTQRDAFLSGELPFYCDLLKSYAQN